jgi:structural maintenance of chromosome 3 (chondroitin sulfate proteoglycan 6)
LEVYKTRSTLNAQVAEKEKELADCRSKLQQVESEVNQLLSEIQRTETKNSKSKVCL